MRRLRTTGGRCFAATRSVQRQVRSPETRPAGECDREEQYRVQDERDAECCRAVRSQEQECLQRHRLGRAWACSSSPRLRCAPAPVGSAAIVRRYTREYSMGLPDEGPRRALHSELSRRLAGPDKSRLAEPIEKLARPDELPTKDVPARSEVAVQ